MKKIYPFIMSRKLILLVTLIFFMTSPVFSQWCRSTDVNSNVQKFPETSQLKNRVQSNDVIVINIFFNILNSGVSSSVTEQQCIDAVETLNDYYKDANIAFRYAGSRNRFSHALASINSPADFLNLRDVNSDEDNLQVFLIDSFYGGSGGQAEFPGTYVTLTKDFLNTFVLAHEIGHNFNLYHTHHGSSVEPDINIPPENIDGSNCETAGDLICDTPADPGLHSGNLNSSTCTYTGGGGYNPDTENIMSYTPPECGEKFTSGQNDWMREALIAITDLQSVQENSIVLAEPIDVTYNRLNYNREHIGNNCFQISFLGIYELQFQKGFNYSIEVTTTNILGSNTTIYTFMPNQNPFIEISENYSYISEITDYIGTQYSDSGTAGFVSYIDCPLYYPLNSQNTQPLQSGQGVKIESGLYYVPIHDKEKKMIIERPKILIKN